MILNETEYETKLRGMYKDASMGAVSCDTEFINNGEGRKTTHNIERHGVIYTFTAIYDVTDDFEFIFKAGKITTKNLF